MTMYDEYEFINRYPKEDVYTLYSHMIDDVKEYEKITRKQMLSSIYDALIEDTSRFDGYVSVDALRYLIEIAQGKRRLKFDSVPEYKLIKELQDAFLLSFYGMPDGFRVPKKIQHIFKDLEITKRHQELDVIYTFLKGVILVKGHVDMDELDKIFQSCKPSHISLSLHDAIMNLPRIFLKINEAAYQFEDVFEHPGFYRSLVYEDYIPTYKHTWETYMSVGQYGLNLYNPILNEFYTKLCQHKDEIMRDIFVDEFVTMTQLNEEFNMRYVLETFMEIEPNMDKAIKLYNDIVVEIPRWQFKGDPISLVDRAQIKKRQEEIQEENEEYLGELCPCGSGLSLIECCENDYILMSHQAILDEKQMYVFYGLYYMLLHRTNEKYKIFPHIANADKFFERLTQPNFVKLAEKFFNSPEIITDYIKQYKRELTSTHLEILTGFQHTLKKTFIALRYENQKLVLLDEEEKKIYMVSGIVSAIALNIPFFVLPQFVETRLIPLNNVITYDVFINQIPVAIGPNIRKELKKVEKQSKIINNIHDM